MLLQIVAIYEAVRLWLMAGRGGVWLCAVWICGGAVVSCAPLSMRGGCRCCDGELYRSTTPCTHYFFARKFLFFFGGVGVGCLRRGAVSGCRVPCGGVVFFGVGASVGVWVQGCEGKDPKGTPYALRASLWPKPLLHSPRIFAPCLQCVFLYFQGPIFGTFVMLRRRKNNFGGVFVLAGRRIWHLLFVLRAFLLFLDNFIVWCSKTRLERLKSNLWNLYFFGVPEPCRDLRRFGKICNCLIFNGCYFLSLYIIFILYISFFYIK